MKNLKRISALIFAAMFMFAACKKDENAAPMQNNPNGEPQAQSFKVKMTDAPGDYEGLDMKVVGVEAYIEGQGWVQLDNRAHAIDVLDLTNGTEVELASKSNADIGVYTKLKVKFDTDAMLTINANAFAEGNNGSIFTDNTVKLVWDGPQEIEVAINEQVSADAGAQVLLDFDVAQSIIRGANKYFIKPAIRELKNTQTGVKGEVEGAASAAITLSDGQNTFSTFIDAEGKFMLRGVNAGTYKMIIQPAKKAIGEIQTQPKEINGVVIVEGEMKQMGQIAL